MRLVPDEDDVLQVLCLEVLIEIRSVETIEQRSISLSRHVVMIEARPYLDPWALTMNFSPCRGSIPGIQSIGDSAILSLVEVVSPV